ncbi:hypothetical protein TIFTF001_009882 [Ficus carica]|uniref:Uncharacterized protein n=1 Tax=Ficus carica TaxID=3494 RepID=A0AA87ZW23_FICCA|nr:hypothetical protein TIFTF001_009882 [Ficus carica]
MTGGGSIDVQGRDVVAGMGRGGEVCMAFGGCRRLRR